MSIKRIFAEHLPLLNGICIAKGVVSIWDILLMGTGNFRRIRKWN